MTSRTTGHRDGRYARGVTLRRRLRIALGAVAYGVLVFAPAGSLRWIEGWVFLGILAAFSAVAIVALRRADSGLLEERTAGLYRDGQPLWDRVWLTLLTLLTPPWLGVAGWDAVRRGWSDVPWWLECVGGAALAVSLVVIVRAMLANPFASHTARLQQDRGQRVIDTGPYAVVRHPMYAAMLLLFPGGSLLLGSWVSLALATLVCGLALVRIPLEERLLRRGLPGYEEYCRRVRHRLIPGVW